MSPTPDQQSSAAQVLDERSVQIVKIGGGNAGQLRENFQHLQQREGEGKKQILVLSAIRSPDAAYSEFADPAVKDRAADGAIKEGFNTTSHLIALAKALHSEDKERARALLQRIIQFTKTIVEKDLKDTEDAHILPELYDVIEQQFSTKLEGIIQAATEHTIESHGEDWMHCHFVSTQSITGLGEELTRNIYTTYFGKKRGTVVNFAEDPLCGVQPVQSQKEVATLQASVRGKIHTLLQEHSVIVAGGYLSYTGKERGYSDFTAAELAVAAHESHPGHAVLVIEKQDPIRSGDPRRFPQAPHVPELTYFSAAETFGSARGANAGAVVFDALKILQEHHIPIVVCNPKQLDQATLIGDIDPQANGIEIVAVRKIPFVMEIRDPSMISQTGFIGRVGKFLQDKGANIDHTVTSESSITITLTKDLPEPVVQQLAEDLRITFSQAQPPRITSYRDLTAIFCIGNNMKRIGVMAEATLALAAANADIHISAQGMNEAVMVFFVDNEKADAAARCIHEFCIIQAGPRHHLMRRTVDAVRGLCMRPVK